MNDQINEPWSPNSDFQTLPHQVWVKRDRKKLHVCFQNIINWFSHHHMVNLFQTRHGIHPWSIPKMGLGKNVGSKIAEVVLVHPSCTTCRLLLNSQCRVLPEDFGIWTRLTGCADTDFFHINNGCMDACCISASV